MKKITLSEVRREIHETELRTWLDVPTEFRLTGIRLVERKDDRGVEIVFVRFDSASNISIETSRLLREEAFREQKRIESERSAQKS